MSTRLTILPPQITHSPTRSSRYLTRTGLYSSTSETAVSFSRGWERDHSWILTTQPPIVELLNHIFISTTHIDAHGRRVSSRWIQLIW